MTIKEPTILRTFDTTEHPKVKNVHIPYCHTRSSTKNQSRTIICEDYDCKIKDKCGFTKKHDLILCDTPIIKIPNGC